MCFEVISVLGEEQAKWKRPSSHLITLPPESHPPFHQNSKYCRLDAVACVYSILLNDTIASGTPCKLVTQSGITPDLVVSGRTGFEFAGDRKGSVNVGESRSISISTNAGK